MPSGPILTLLLALASTPDAGQATPTAARASPTPRPVDSRWNRQTRPAPGAPAAIGGYNNGCLRGAEALPLSGPGYELLRPGRRRSYGHPALIAFLRRLGASVREARLPTLAIGDLTLPRGGPTPTGHKSHQTGLDVDIAFLAPAWVGKRAPVGRERHDWEPAVLVNHENGKLLQPWPGHLARTLELAAADPAVDRIFVNAGVKREVCKRVPARDGVRPSWVRKLRPWWAHHDHFHVRLACPADPARATGPKDPGACLPQAPLPPGDGCDNLDWWLSPEARKGPPAPVAPPAAPPPPPPACAGVLTAP
jgi:penicillin-insensitive murein endopeptidase